MSKLHVLIVDDDSSVRRIIARTFESSGFSTSTAADGEKAIILLNEHSFDVMISDIDMPRMDGKQLCRHLATKGPYLPKHTIIVTGQLEQNTRDWLDEFEGIKVIEKPVGPRQLVRAVKDLLASDLTVTQ
jgi:CheY-like chemotaxis protein